MADGDELGQNVLAGAAHWGAPVSLSPLRPLNCEVDSLLANCCGERVIALCPRGAVVDKPAARRMRCGQVTTSRALPDITNGARRFAINPRAPLRRTLHTQLHMSVCDTNNGHVGVAW